MTVALVIVSHSARIADGVVELAAQMAQGVPIEAAGGTDDGAIGTSYDRIEAAITAALEAAGGDGVVVLYDLGSALMTTETYLEFQDDDVRDRVRLVDAPLVEGAVAAGVEAASGASLDAVAAVAAAAWGRGGADASGGGGEVEDATTAPTDAGEGAEPGASGAPAVMREVEIRNESGIHARPAATIVKLVATFDAAVTIGGVNASGLLGLLSLGLTRGDRTEVRATGPDAQAAVDALAAEFDDGFGEPTG